MLIIHFKNNNNKAIYALKMKQFFFLFFQFYLALDPLAPAPEATKSICC